MTGDWKPGEWAVAEAIYNANRKPLPGNDGSPFDRVPPTWQHASDAVKEFVLWQARAAMAAYRDIMTAGGGATELGWKFVLSELQSAKCGSVDADTLIARSMDWPAFRSQWWHDDEQRYIDEPPPFTREIGMAGQFVEWASHWLAQFSEAVTEAAYACASERALTPLEACMVWVALIVRVLEKQSARAIEPWGVNERFGH